MLTRNFITSSIILFAGYHQYVYAIEDVSLPSQVLQDQRLKELNQQLQDQLAQQTPYQNTKPLQDFKHLVVEESPCVAVKKISLIPLTGHSESDLQQFNFVIKAIKKHPQNILGKCIGTQSLHNIVNYAQNELLKKGFITSQIVVSPQDLNQGNLNLSVQIGRLNKIIIQEGKISSLQLKTGLPFKAGDIVNLKKLDQGLENLKRVYAVDMQITPATAQALKYLPAELRKTLTYDRGREMSEHKILEEDLGIDVYFCDPHSPWQKGTCENMNGLIRQYLPKGIDLNQADQHYLNQVAMSLNTRPRKALDWLTPLEKFAQLVDYHMAFETVAPHV